MGDVRGWTGVNETKTETEGLGVYLSEGRGAREGRGWADARAHALPYRSARGCCCIGAVHDEAS